MRKERNKIYRSRFKSNKTFGLKHSAREIAEKANVPLLSGTGLISDTDIAVNSAEKSAILL